MGDLYFANYAVAWIDVLGQTSLLENIGPIPSNDAEKAAFITPLKVTFGRVGGFRDILLKFQKQLTQKSNVPENLKNNLSKDDLAMCEKYTNPSVEPVFLADAAMLNVCLRDDSEFSPLVGIYSMLDILSLTMLTCLAAHTPLRGGVDIGVCARITDAELYGQAVSRAHYLEQKVSKYPRIVVGNNLMNYLKAIEQFATSLPVTPEKRIQKGWLKHIVGKLESDADDNNILSYLKGRHSNLPTFTYLVNKAQLFIRDMISTFTLSGNKMLADRYEMLRQYFERSNCWS